MPHVGKHVRLGGWVHRRRDLGGLVFIDLRDRAGLVQLSCNPDWTPAAVMERAAGAGAETVVMVTGTVALRPEPSRDPALGSREVEVHVTDLEITGPAQTPAIPVARKEKEELAAEELRLRHRVLDLRRPELQQNIILRHRLLQRARRTLNEMEFLEIETPILTKPTPEGARDYLVPSRIHPGEFYALPQSPQIYKQLLMVAGYDRYFQIARCFRDEDLRADRQPEFTQIDLEASFMSAEDIQQVVERTLVELWDEGGFEVARPFPAPGLARRHGALRHRQAGPAVRARDPGPDPADSAPTPLRSWQRRGRRVAGSARSPSRAARRFRGRTSTPSPPRPRKPRRAASSGRGGRPVAGKGRGSRPWGRRCSTRWAERRVTCCLAAAGPDAVTSPALHARPQRARAPARGPSHDRARVRLGGGFPALRGGSRDGETRAGPPPVHRAASGRPRTLDIDPARVRALHYDAIYNGNELGSGSIRITDPGLQRRIFELLGIPEAEVRRRFGFLLDGLAAGAPPHGGFALGFDRITMLLAGAPSLRDVIAFPKTTAARALFEGAPTPVDPNDLRALHLRPADE